MLSKLKAACTNRQELLAKTQHKKQAFLKLLNELEANDSLEYNAQLQHLEQLEGVLTKQLHHFEQTLSELLRRRDVLLKKAKLTWLSQQSQALSDFALRAKAELKLEDFNWQHHAEELNQFLSKTDIENSL